MVWLSMNRRIRDLVAQVNGHLRPKAKSLLVTVYGDAIQHHGGCAGLGSVITLAGALGLNERVVRTSMVRLANEEWLVSSQIGRRSFYRLTDIGRHRFDAVEERIYRRADTGWDGYWTLLIANIPPGDGERRDALRRYLGWLGFGQLAGGIMLHPNPDPNAVRQAILDAQAGGQVVVMRATTESWTEAGALHDVLDTCWTLSRLADDYTDFLETFRPLWLAMSGTGELDPETCFVVRTILMHGFRRALLRDPMLPDQLLPADWPGNSARLLCRNLYRRIQAPAEHYVMSVLETPEGPAPEAVATYFSRFGGLAPLDGVA